jgi:A/G-specific adenine glycosylase
MSFARLLAAWYDQHQRDLPWRRTRDPYAIWLSEIMLQQTRVTAVIPYYERFLARFPDYQTLAAAPEPDLLAAWAGLGYYSRARNLQAAARRMVAAGGFPTTYEGIRALPGVGDYTAGAIASIAYGLPHVGLDGNVLRVLARYLAEPGDITHPATRQRLKTFAESTLDRAHPGRHQQALIELGATVCLPRNPQCLLCPLAAECRARQQGIAHQLPIKLRKAQPILESRTLLLIRRRGKLLLWQRPPESRRLAGFWELPEPGQLPQAAPGPVLATFQHAIVNHTYTLSVAEASLAGRPPAPFVWQKENDLSTLPLSTIARKALKQAPLVPRPPIRSISAQTAKLSHLTRG